MRSVIGTPRFRASCPAARATALRLRVEPATARSRLEGAVDPQAEEDLQAAQVHLVESVATQPRPQGRKRERLLRYHVAEIHIGAEGADHPELLLLARRLEHQPVPSDVLDD